MRATAPTQPGPVSRPGRAALRDPRRLVHSPKVPHTKWTETRGPVTNYTHWCFRQGRIEEGTVHGNTDVDCCSIFFGLVPLSKHWSWEWWKAPSEARTTARAEFVFFGPVPLPEPEPPVEVTRTAKVHIWINAHGKYSLDGFTWRPGDPYRR